MPRHHHRRFPLKTHLSLPAITACLCVGVQAQTAPQAPNTKTVTVTATVLDTCKFDTGSTVDLTLNNLDPSSSTSASQNGSVNYRCTKGFAPKIKLVGSSGTAIDGAAGTEITLAHATVTTESIKAAIKTPSSTAPTGEGFSPGTTLSLSLTAEVQPSAFQNALGGRYTGSLTIQLTP